MTDRPNWRRPLPGDTPPTVEHMTDLEIARVVAACRDKPADQREPAEQCVVELADQVEALRRR